MRYLTLEPVRAQVWDARVARAARRETASAAGSARASGSGSASGAARGLAAARRGTMRRSVWSFMLELEGIGVEGVGSIDLELQLVGMEVVDLLDGLE